MKRPARRAWPSRHGSGFALANRGAGCDERSNTPGQFVLTAVENTIAEEGGSLEGPDRLRGRFDTNLTTSLVIAF